MKNNTLLKMNIDKYMDLKGFRFYTDLLYAIGLRLGLKGNELEIFPDKEKNNFSKMLKGERPLKYEFIIPLEEIFGVSLAKILNDNNYYPSINKADIPFIKGFRYYAHIDDYDLYDELFQNSTVDGEMIICNSDEYNRFLLDYLIEYRSFNGIRYLVDKYGFKFDEISSQYVTNLVGNIPSNLPLQISKLIIDSNDDVLFNKIYDIYYVLIKYNYADYDCLFKKDEFIEAILNNDNIYRLIFVEKKYAFNLINEGVKPKDGLEPDVVFINPLINIVLDYSLLNLEYYKKQALEIIEFGINYNRRVIDNLQYPIIEYHHTDTGIILDRSRNRIYGNIVTINKETNDKEIIELIKILPRL